MNRNRVVKIQLFLVFVVAGLLVWRVTRGPAVPPGLVSLTDISLAQVRSASFRLDAPERITVDAVGSVDAAGSEQAAAYGWIVSRADRSLVWEQDPRSSTVERTLMTTRDSLDLQPGEYDVYFAGYGPNFDSRSGRAVLGLKPHWTNDSKYWRMVVGVSDPASASVIDSEDALDSEALWSTGTLRNGQSKSTRIQVLTPSSLRMYAILEICGSECDHARVIDLGSSRTLWEMTEDNTVPAGGSTRNRLWDGTLALSPGLYEVAVSTDRDHGASAWRANPPHDPPGWGLRVWAESGEVGSYDPWSSGEDIVSFLRVGNDADLEAEIQVADTVSVMVVSTGEVGSGDSIYDYAWIERVGDGSKVWKMTVDAAEPAGGDRSNRTESAIVVLTPGNYLLRYVSDESHSYGDWRRPEPTQPGRWGVALFPISASARDSGVVSVVSRTDRAKESARQVDEPSPEVSTPPDTSDLLFEAAPLGNDAERSGSITLETATKLRIIAVGEISDGGRYDYGWIESSSGETVWEMTRRNTVAAGGNDINRKFDGVIELEAGTYQVHFKTDFSHASGDFGGGPPEDASGWGIRVFRAPG